MDREERRRRRILRQIRDLTRRKRKCEMVRYSLQTQKNRESARIQEWERESMGLRGREITNNVVILNRNEGNCASRFREDFVQCREYMDGKNREAENFTEALQDLIDRIQDKADELQERIDALYDEL
ncbi:hypothetical protein [Oribacterium sp. oral taxon 078]|uniref:hypothetical protein n=1 Tax=Oribacterium sp. oral taxon 078 TaxID=652706 RepID=UPI00040BBF88|nr:hypothetical protein [Oribacterium sp. oral taxon 078]